MEKKGENIMYGVSTSITLDGPTQDDVKSNEQLVSLLKSMNLFETERGLRKRELILGSLNRLLHNFIQAVCINQGFDEEETNEVSARLLTFGSYRLGVIGPDSDIDALCLCPQRITRNDFFTVFYNILANHPNVSKIHAVTDAYTPLIKLVYDDVDIDMLFAILPMPTISPNLNILDDDILRNLDDITARSINGCRVASLVLSSVPNEHNFRITLRFIKLWAQKRGIYSNILGYLGGVAWAILTARVCQLYPNYLPNQLIAKFFKVYMLWNWKYPVIINKIKQPVNIPGLMMFKVWDPKTNPQDRLHLMPVITPAFPAMNSTHNVTNTTKRVMINEFKRAHELIKSPAQTNWNDLLEPANIFNEYKHFLAIIILASDDQSHSKWHGWIESRIRFLIRKLETIENTELRPWPYSIPMEDPTWTNSKWIFIALSYNKIEESQFDIRTPIKEFKNLIFSWHELPSYESKVDVRIEYIKRSQLPELLTGRKTLKRRKKTTNPLDEYHELREHLVGGTPTPLLCGPKSAPNSGE